MIFCDCGSERFLPLSSGKWKDTFSGVVWENDDKKAVCDEEVTLTSSYHPFIVKLDDSFDTIQWSAKYLNEMMQRPLPEWWPPELYPQHDFQLFKQRWHISFSDMFLALATKWLQALLITSSGSGSSNDLPEIQYYFASTWLWGVEIVANNGDRYAKNAPNLALAAKSSFLITRKGWFITQDGELLPPVILING